jgi:hypothetical protein
MIYLEITAFDERIHPTEYLRTGAIIVLQKRTKSYCRPEPPVERSNANYIGLKLPE